MDYQFEPQFDFGDHSHPDERTWRQKLAGKIIKFLWLRPWDKMSGGGWTIGEAKLRWNRTLCWLRGHKWLYVRSTQPAGPRAVEQKRGRLCQCCDAFTDLGSRLIEQPYTEPLEFGVFAEGE